MSGATFMEQRYHQIKRIKIMNLPGPIDCPMIPVARAALAQLSPDQTSFA
jgi:hypothetical protein